MHNLLTVGDTVTETVELAPGELPLFAFHGFGQRAQAYAPLAQAWQGTFRTVGVHLFHHGRSTFPSHRLPTDPLRQEELIQLAEALRDTYSADKFALAGYSLGGKVVLSMLTHFPEKIHSVWLFAPDGIRKSRLYDFAANTRTGRTIYERILRKPNAFLGGVRLLNRTGVLSDKMTKFTLSHMDTLEKRTLVRNVWQTYRHTNPNVSEVVQITREYDIPVYPFFGRFDPLMPPAIGKRFAQRIGQPENFYELEAGHHLLQEKTAQVIENMRHKKRH